MPTPLHPEGRNDGGSIYYSCDSPHCINDHRDGMCYSLEDCEKLTGLARAPKDTFYESDQAIYLATFEDFLDKLREVAKQNQSPGAILNAVENTVKTFEVLLPNANVRLLCYDAVNSVTGDDSNEWYHTIPALETHDDFIYALGNRGKFPWMRLNYPKLLQTAISAHGATHEELMAVHQRYCNSPVLGDKIG